MIPLRVEAHVEPFFRSALMFRSDYLREEVGNGLGLVSHSRVKKCATETCIR